MKKVISLLLSLVMFVSSFPATAVFSYADDIEYTTINTNGTWYQGYISDSNIVDWYKINVPSDGEITIKLMHYMYTIYEIFNDDLSKRIDFQNPTSGSSDSPVTETYNYSLSKGKYYIKISKSQYNSGYTGKYKVSSTFKTYGTNEIEPNDFENASYLSPGNEIIGAITHQDSVDWFKINVPSNLNITVKLKHYMYTIYEIFNDDLSKRIDFRNPTSGSSDSPVTETYNYSLSKGKYYIKISNSQYNSGYTGKYNLSWNFNIKVSKPSNFKVSTRNTTSLKLSWSKVGGVSGYQLQRKSGDSYKTITNTTSTSRTVKDLKAGTTYKFRVRAYKTISGKKYYSAWRYLTTPTKPSKPSIKTPSTNKKHQIIAKWKAVSRCSGYQVQYSRKKNFSSVIATKTVSGRTKTSYTGKNFTKGKRYYVRVRSYKTVDGTKYYSAWSSVKSIKCK